MAKTSRRRAVGSSSQSRRARAIKAGYRSGLEEDEAARLTELGVKYEYESLRIKWTDKRERTYTPDFVLPNGIIIETKGRFDPDDRRKHLEVRKQHPELDIRFVFSRANAPINKGSATSCAMWCEKNGFLWSDKQIPDEWLAEDKPKEKTK